MSMARAHSPAATAAEPLAVAVPRYDLRAGEIHTSVSPRVARGVVFVFLAMILSVPLAQTAIELIRDRRLQSLDVLSHWPTKQSNHLFEQDLEDASIARSLFRPRLQSAMLRWGGFANTKVILGRDGWLYYAPGLDYVAGRGFLRPDVVDQRRAIAARDGERIWPDPRPAIFTFHRDLAHRGIRLLLVPVADKAMRPGALGTRRMQGVTNNPDYPKLIDELRTAGIDVLDAIPPADGENDCFLRQDTHWTPQWMAQAARQLADHILAMNLLPQRPSPTLTVHEQEITALGDLARMLRLPASAPQLRPQTIKINQVHNARLQSLWQGSRDADILLLCDSFGNVFSDPQLGWGESAGLPEHLSRFLARDLDVIARNDGGAYGTRQALANELGRGKDRLANKKLVIWQFAMRELSCGDWRPIRLSLGPPRPQCLSAPPSGQEMIITGQVEQTSALPRPGAPYKDHIMAIVVERSADNGPSADDRFMVYLWSLRDGQRTDASRLRAGRQVKLRIRNWDDVSWRLDRISRSEVTDTVDVACWGEIVK